METAKVETINKPSEAFSSGVLRALWDFTGDMRPWGEWVRKQIWGIQLIDYTLRGVAQVMFVNNSLSGLLILGGLFLQNPWWALNGLVGTATSTMSAIALRQNRDAVSAGLHGYNGTLVGILMAVFSAKEGWYMWLFVPNVLLSMLCPIVSSALSAITSKWDVPIFTLPFNILICLHVAATGTTHPIFPQVDFQPRTRLHENESESLNLSQVFLSVPVGVGQVFGCDNPWTGGFILLALLLCSPTICFHAVLGSTAGLCTGLALAAPHTDVYSGVWGYNSVLSCIAIGGVFYALTWQSHILALTCAFFCAYASSATSKLMSALSLPACTWPFCLSTLIFLLLSSENPALCRLPLAAVSYPEENRRYLKQLKAWEKAQSSIQEAPESGESPNMNLHDNNLSLRTLMFPYFLGTLCSLSVFYLPYFLRRIFVSLFPSACLLVYLICWCTRLESSQQETQEPVTLPDMCGRSSTPGG